MSNDILTLQKVNKLPDTIEASTLYFVKKPNNELEIHLTSKLGTEIYKTGGVSPTVKGPTTLTRNISGSYRITNYDIETSYNVSTEFGSVSILDDIITYTSPDETGLFGFTLNNKIYNISIVEATPDAPVIISPKDLTYNLLPNITIELAAYKILGKVVDETIDFINHCNSVYFELSDNVNFNNLIATGFKLKEETIDPTTFLKWDLEDLDAGATYYVRAKFTSNSETESDWSAITTFTIKSNINAPTATDILYDVEGNNGDWFGSAVSINALGDTIVVGARLADEGYFDAGCGYVFNKINNVWIFIAKLTANDPHPGDYLGVSSAISSDGTCIALGAYYGDSTQVDTGSVYVYRLNNSLWELESKITLEDINTGSYFGCSIVFNSDASILIIGSSGDDGVVDNTGCAYVYEYNEGNWLFISKLIAPDSAANDRFGTSVATNASGDLIAVGAMDSDSGTGSVHVFNLINYNYDHVAKLIPFDGGDMDQFGCSIDINQNGNTIIIGARESNGAFDSQTGSAYIFILDSGEWIEKDKLMLIDGLDGDQFGNSVAINAVGDKVLIGAHYRFNEPGNIGSAYTFIFNGVSWNLEYTFLSNNISSSTDPYFGYSVCMDASGNELVISVPQNEIPESLVLSSGTVVIYN